uniref:Uncharacterized protein LOC111099860 n=1 Tax=Crassostrea virginica TaxID=6565 RepID=A0A8B8A7A6_CRAVI|nr:uncharacterized protein LOC111099860 [Crassostrea virginica]
MATQPFYSHFAFVCLHIFMMLSTFHIVNMQSFQQPRLQKRYTREDICNKTLFTVKEVVSCPTNKDEIQQRSKAKMCHIFPPCDQESLLYHCLIFQNKFVELCAPTEHIKGGVCPLLDKGLGRVVEDYRSSCFSCPFRYYSNESSMYSECTKQEAPSSTTITPCNKSGTRVERSSECNKPTTPVTIGVTADKETSDTSIEDAVPPKSSTGDGIQTNVIIILMAAVEAVILHGVILVDCLQRRLCKDKTHTQNTSQESKSTCNNANYESLLNKPTKSCFIEVS